MRFARPALRRKGRAHPASGGSATYRESLFNDSSTELLGRLMYELLDAHADTAYLAAELSSDPIWAAHLDYLRALQRKAKETLARACTEVTT